MSNTIYLNRYPVLVPDDDSTIKLVPQEEKTDLINVAFDGENIFLRLLEELSQKIINLNSDEYENYDALMREIAFALGIDVDYGTLYKTGARYTTQAGETPEKTSHFGEKTIESGVTKLRNDIIELLAKNKIEEAVNVRAYDLSDWMRGEFIPERPEEIPMLMSVAFKHIKDLFVQLRYYNERQYSGLHGRTNYFGACTDFHFKSKKKKFTDTNTHGIMKLVKRFEYTHPAIADALNKLATLVNHAFWSSTKYQPTDLLLRSIIKVNSNPHFEKGNLLLLQDMLGAEAMEILNTAPFSSIGERLRIDDDILYKQAEIMNALAQEQQPKVNELGERIYLDYLDRKDTGYYKNGAYLGPSVHYIHKLYSLGVEDRIAQAPGPDKEGYVYKNWHSEIKPIHDVISNMPSSDIPEFPIKISLEKAVRKANKDYDKLMS